MRIPRIPAILNLTLQENDNYWYGLFGDFKIIRYINTTKLCKSGGNCLEIVKKLENAKSLIQYYEKQTEAHKQEITVRLLFF